MHRAIPFGINQGMHAHESPGVNHATWNILLKIGLDYPRGGGEVTESVLQLKDSKMWANAIE